MSVYVKKVSTYVNFSDLFKTYMLTEKKNKILGLTVTKNIPSMNEWMNELTELLYSSRMNEN